MKLYMAHVGFYDNEIGMFELHSNIFVVAKDALAAKQKIREKDVFIAKNMHIDGLQEMLCIDGYNISVTNADNYSANKIYDYEAVKNLG